MDAFARTRVCQAGHNGNTYPPGDKLNRIMRQVDRAAAVISRMRVFGRMSAASPAVVDLREVCKEAPLLLQQRLRKGGITVRTELGATPNLMLNGIDAFQNSKRTDKEIVISGRAANGRILVVVADNGPDVGGSLTLLPGEDGAGFQIDLPETPTATVGDD
jgi:C4-dicarboxylate-specific signal transduction histidine kinase